MPATPPISEETYQRWKQLALNLCRAGGWPRDLIPLLGLSEDQWQSFLDALGEPSGPRGPVERYPVQIPPTSPTSYISCEHALSISLPGEHTGGGSFKGYFFACLEATVAPLAGPGEIVDSTPSLGSKGVRDMGRIIADHKGQPSNGPVYVANHYRALADIALRELMDSPIEEVRELHPHDVLSASNVNDMLNFEDEEIDLLVEEYLRPLGSQLQGIRKDAFDRWLPTVVVLP